MGEDDMVILKPDEIQDLINSASSPSFRNSLVIEVLWRTAIRADEMTRIRLDDLQIDEEPYRIRINSAKINDQEEELFWRHVYVPKQTVRRLRMWKNKRRAAYPTSDESNRLFITNTHPYMRHQRVNQIVKEAAENAGHQYVLGETTGGKQMYAISSHTIRRSWATMAVNDLEIPLTTVAELMGHTNLETTKQYVLTNDSALHVYKRVR